MPEGKKLLGVWIEADKYEQFRVLAESRKMSVSSLTRSLVYGVLGEEVPTRSSSPIAKQDPYFARVQAWSLSGAFPAYSNFTLAEIGKMTIGGLSGPDDPRRIGIIMSYLGWKRTKKGWRHTG